MKVMILIKDEDKVVGHYYKGFKDIDEIIRYCTAKTNGKYTYDFEVIK